MAIRRSTRSRRRSTSPTRTSRCRKLRTGRPWRRSASTSRRSIRPSATPARSPNRARAAAAAAARSRPRRGRQLGRPVRGRRQLVVGDRRLGHHSPQHRGRARRRRRPAPAQLMSVHSLSAQSALVTNYFSLRVSDARRRVLEESVAAYGHSLEIVRNQFNAGTVTRSRPCPGADAVRADARAAGRRGCEPRRVLGAAAEVRGPDRPLSRRVQPRSGTAAPIGADGRWRRAFGAARAATRHRRGRAANGGGQRRDRRGDRRLLSEHHAERQHQLCQHHAGQPAVYQPTRCGRSGRSSPAPRSTAARGRRRSNCARRYDGTVATYRQTVITAFQQVEDALVQQRILEQQEEVQRAAVAAARQAEQLAMNQYRAGTVPYTTVIRPRPPRCGRSSPCSTSG